MKERPILFSAPMVLAILEGRKSQTRRVIKGIDQECDGLEKLGTTWQMIWNKSHNPEKALLELCNSPCPYGESGDHIWVREEMFTPVNGDAWNRRFHFAADGKPSRMCSNKEKPSRKAAFHMPRWASRITLEITDIRVEKLQQISEEDARAEGVDEWIPCNAWTGLNGVRIGGALRQETCRAHFALVWNSINDKRPGHSWRDNPWCWCLSFRRIEPASNPSLGDQEQPESKELTA